MRFALSVVAALTLAPLASAQDPKTPAPRRMLFVQVGGYLYMNPLTHAAPGGADRTRAAADRFAAGFRVPVAKDNDQLFVLADTLATDSRLPTKETLAKSIDGFCATTREQDRVVIYFGAHAIEKDGKAYLVPIDGDPDAVDTLLPVADVYAKLKDLKAAQKVVVWDVCRHNPERIRARRDAGPMTDALFKALTTPPEGVQVLVSCSPGERSLEYFTPSGTAGMFPGSAYLDALRHAATEDEKAAPGDAIPVDAIHKAASKLVAALGKQTPTSAGTLPTPPAQPAAKRFEWPAPPKSAPAADVKSIFAEVGLPSVCGDDDNLLAKLPFTEGALKEYAADVSTDDIRKDREKYPLRVATLGVTEKVRGVWTESVKNVNSVTPMLTPITDKTKKTVSQIQESLAIAIAELELELAKLEAVADLRAKETKRWQAHYDYTLAELRLRIVLLNEYNLALARIRTESLPDLVPDAPGWRLAPTAGLTSRREIKDMLVVAQESLAKVAADYKGTPWEVLAKRSRALVPGLYWESMPAAKPVEK